MMDFFEHQDRARQRTGMLVALFGLAVAAIIVAVYFAVMVSFAFSTDLLLYEYWWWSPEIFFPVSVVTLLVVFAGSAYRIVTLSGGGAKVAELLGGRPVSANSSDPGERQLRNVVEEMSIAAGVPVPGLYVLADEPGINAFAAGTRPDNAVIAVTRGCLETLTRDELQGVIAHEYSHILNSDMQLNIRLIGILNGILVLGLIGEILLRGSRHGRVTVRRSGKGNGAGAIILFGLLLWLIGSIGAFFGNLIKAAVSRQREFLADAAAVQFTRNPAGLAGALEKIAAATSIVTSPRAAEASHLFFGQGVKPAFFGLLATHPPVDERVRRIRGTIMQEAFSSKVTAQPARPVGMAAPAGAAGLSGVATAGAMGFVSGNAAAPAAATVVAASAGQLDPSHLAYARRMLDGLPAELGREAREPLGALATLYALLLAEDAATREFQIGWLREHAGAAVADIVRRLAPLTAQAGAAARLPLAELALASLQEMSQAQYERARRIITELVKWDKSVSLFEYALLRLIGQRLDARFAPAPRPGVKHLSLAPVLGEVTVLLSALAHAGGGTIQQQGEAFLAGRKALGPAGARCTLLAPAACGLERVDAALEQLQRTAPGAHKTLLAALAEVVACDGEVVPAEMELLRAVAAALDIPVPPLAA